ncbi:MAG TPA: hypothetical protein VI589_06930 [Vicinamibacteria bacterium]
MGHDKTVVVGRRACPICENRWTCQRPAGTVAGEVVMEIEESQEIAARVNALARLLHESGREAVEKKLIYRDDVPVKPFCEWNDLPVPARDGRRLMARFLMAHANEVAACILPLSVTPVDLGPGTLIEAIELPASEIADGDEGTPEPPAPESQADGQA